MCNPTRYKWTPHSSFHRLGRFALLGFCLAASLWLTGCSSLPTEIQRPTSSALSTAGSVATRLGGEVARRAGVASTKNDSAFALVGSAELAFTSRMTLIKAAEKTLDLQYYAIHADETTERLFEALKEAADRGVRVRMLLDDFNTAGKKRPSAQTWVRKEH